MTTAKAIQAFAAACEHAKLAKNRGATSLAVLGKVPLRLTELWQWSDGMKQPCFFEHDSDSLDDDEGLRFLSVKQAVKERARAHVPTGAIPFASDLGGGLLLATDKGKVVFWDHETRKAAPWAASIDAFLTSSAKALRKRGAADVEPAQSPLAKEIAAMLTRALALKGPIRAKAAALMNDDRARGTDKQDDQWFHAQLKKLLAKA